MLYLLYASFSAILLFALHRPKEEQRSSESYKIHMDRVALVESGSEGALLRLDLIEDAQSSIDVATYTFTNGTYTQTFLSCLLNAADRGVQVRILQDGLTRIAYERGFLKDALRGFETHPNIEIRYYEKFNPLIPWAWQTRLHDKIMVVDGKLALIGGRNIGDKYFLEDAYQHRFVRDRDVLIYQAGPQTGVIGEMQSYYDALWNYKHTKAHRKGLSTRQIRQGSLSNAKLREHYMETRKQGAIHVDWMERTQPTEGVQFVHNPLGRGNTDPWCLKVLLDLASQAQISIMAQSPYIIPSRRMYTVAKQSNVDWKKVSILTNSTQSSPNPIAMAAYHNHRDHIVDKAGQVHEFQGPCSIHSKSYIIDKSISIIGTYNLDARSSYINTESMVIIRCGKLAQELGQNMEKQRQRSALVEKDYSYGGLAVDKKPLWLFSKVVGLFDFLL